MKELQDKTCPYCNQPVGDNNRTTFCHHFNPDDYETIVNESPAGALWALVKKNTKNNNERSQ